MTHVEPTRAQLPAELNADLTEILGMPNFRCSPIAHAFRSAGRAIPPRAEDEQAFVLHWLLTLYLEHGTDWRRHAADQLDAARRSLESGDRSNG
jgi:hypothetical protein